MCGGDDHLAWAPYRSDHLYRVTLDYVFHSMSLSCFLPRAFVFLSWLDTSFHFAITYLMLRDMFIDHDHLVFALYTYHGFRSQFRSRLSLESHFWRKVGDSSIEMSDELASTFASIQEFMAGALPLGVSVGTPFHLADHYETIPPPTVIVPPPIVTTIDYTRLVEQEARMHGTPTTSLPTKFCMLNIERYSGIDCPKIHLRLYNTVMRAHGIDDAQLVALFPMSLSRATQRWFASVEPSRVRTWDDVAHEFLTQFTFSADIDVSRRELEATRQRPDESISSFVNRWRAKVAGMIDRPKEQDQIDMVLRNLQPRFARHLVGIPFQDLKSLVHAAFSVEEAIARGLWTDTTPSPDSKGKKPIGPFSRYGEYQYQPVYVQEPYIAQTSMQPRPPHPRATTHPPPRPYAQRPVRQFTPLGMTLTRAFEKLKDGAAYTIRFRDMIEHCSTRHHAIQDLIDSRLVNLAGPSVTTNPLPTHSTHVVPPPPSL
ncbi:hypothetical protein AAG906_029284 [Vitis piasezkii]